MALCLDVKRLFWLVLLAGLALSAPLTAGAQELSPFEIAGGYSLLTREEARITTEIRIPAAVFHGWFLSTTRNINNWSGLTAEAGGNYLTEARFGGLSNLERRLYSVLGGPQFTLRSQGRAVPFVRVLFGVAHETARLRHNGVPRPEDTDSLNRGVVELGGGIIVRFERRVALKVSANYRRTVWHGQEDQFRLSSGLNVSLGSR